MATRERVRLATEPSRVLLIADFKNVIYRSTSTHASLFAGRTFTGGLYGFMVSLLRAVRDVAATSVVVATDAPPYVRKAEFDGYKGDRKKNRDPDDPLLMKAAQSMPIAKDFIEHLDIPFWEAEGFEYDDLCAWAAQQYHHRFDRVVAMTNDSDLYQLFDIDNFTVYRGSEKGLYGRAEFVKEYGDLSRDDWINVLCMTGTHNAVPGIDGVGPKTALKAIKDPVVMRNIVDKHGKVLERNRPLVTLPHAKFKAMPDHRLRKHVFELRDFVRFCNRYEIQVTARMVEALTDLRQSNGNR